MALENMIPRRIFRNNWYENDEWKRLLSEELQNAYSSRVIVKVIKSRILS